MPAKSTAARDWMIIAGVLVVVTAGYFTLHGSSAPPPPPPARQAEMPAGHDGDDMEGAMGMLSDLPADYDGLVESGNRYMDGGNFPVAAECYRRALDMQEDPNVRVDFGACLHGMGLPGRAIEEFKTVIANHPRHSIAHFNLGVVYFTDTQADSAKAYLSRYLELEPEGRAAATAREILNEIGS